MTKTGSTKNKILNLLLSGNKTLSEISEELDLAPSTVSQHLEELKNMGAIEAVDTEHIRKWKYYRLNPNFNYNSSPIGQGIIIKKLQNRVFYYAIGIGLIAALAYFVLFSNTGSAIIAQPQNGTFVPVRLTDPPNVPNGTQSLIISYSSVAVHVNSNTGSGWVESNSSGTIDLMSLLNVSQVIAGIKVAPNSTIDAARFNITSAEITINNTIYNITVPSRTVLAQVTAPGKVNATTGVLVDLSPTVVALYTNNSTVFVMVPSVKAVVVPSSNSNSTANFKASSAIGYRARLDTDDIYHLQSAKENISITGASLVQANDSLSLQVTVKNNGNQSVSLGDIFIVGNQTPVFTYNSTCNFTPTRGKAMPVWCRISGSTANDLAAGIMGHIVVVHHPFHAMLPSQLISTTGSIATNITNQEVSINNNVNETRGSSVSIVRTYGNVYVTNALGGARFRVHIQGSNGFNYTQNQTPASTNLHEWNRTPVDIKVEFPEGANSPLASGNLSINGTVLMHFINPSPRNFNGSVGGYAYPIPMIQTSRGIEFVIQSNGNLSLENEMYPALAGGEMSEYGSGYTLKPGQSATFTFTGQISLPGDFRISLVPGAHYNIAVFGSSGAHAVTNATAT